MGNCIVVTWDDALLSYVSRNVSSPFVAHSFRLIGRGLTGKEQLDLSVALNSSDKFSDSGPLERRNLYCSQFLQSYTGFNGTMDCHDAPPFTCQRLWINSGLSAVSQLSSVKSSMVSSFTCQTISLPAHTGLPTSSSSVTATVRSYSSGSAPPAHSAWPKGSSSAKVTVRSSSSVPALPSTTSSSTSLQTVIQSVLVIVSSETTYTTTYRSTLGLS